MANKELVDFIREAKARGYDVVSIREALLDNGWLESDIEKGFDSLIEKHVFKNQITIFLDSEVLRLIEKRADKNMLSVPEQIVDILRRSTLNQKSKKTYEPKIDDTLVGLFSRKRTGPKGK